ncbi:DUF3466 family protein [Vibrio hepatarius]|uniref:DUF3466 family protein n=1 Tax=Vibrio hepatarius TaxID=171383 RepID=UPI00148D486D|nr:DUF3466 family protein [Vibrio hepatarius]NOI12989.1 DUF3466 family protein [Vibrio hepatarius]
MSSKIFKISMIAATVAASFSASAAIYNVHMYGPVDSSSQTFGSAIQDSSEDCWGSDPSEPDVDCSINHSTNHKIGYEEQRFLQGFEYRNEAPFLFEYGYEFLEDGRDGFEDYCNRYLDYSDTLCEKWAYRQYYSGYAKEVSGDYQNVTAYVETTQDSTSSNNTVINDLDGSGLITGSYQVSGSERTRGFVDGTDVPVLGDRTQAFATGNGLTVGSISTQSTKYSSDYTSKAAVWDGTNLTSIDWVGASESNRSMPQGSARDVAFVDTNGDDIGDVDYAVGYNANSDEIPVAAVFDLSDLTNDIPTKFVSKYTDDDKYLNSLLTSVNNKGVAIGTAKYREANDGAYSNSLFYVPDVTASSLSSKSFSGDIFFKSANGKAGAINNNNEVVGAIDYERHRESNGGKPRAQRAFIAPIEGATNAAIFKNRAWYLDDLTNGIAANNQFRIIDATDINDAGVIAGTAYYCDGGYESSAINAKCSSGASLVAVKLVPISDENSRSISPRPVDQNKVERQGGSIGVWALTILALFGFRRK